MPMRSRRGDGQLLLSMSFDEPKLMQIRMGGVLVPVVLAVVEPAIIMARRVPTTAATCVR